MDESNAKRIGYRIRRARMWRGRQQAELARRIGLSPTSLHLIEKGEVLDPRSSIVRALAQELEISPSFLLGLSDQMEESPAAVEVV